ncbi:DUF2798 domain-containing protein [uncultured Sulfitobacter sp.]|uniref:DUF2798 domain-containing protein n=1 Tax=uncultured Sulfitobacter sp. TaxID=191468 RepID=UPI0026149A6A|nr:DUF2798 domain-containing protein [uncultured Sulfitobacter sp.]
MAVEMTDRKHTGGIISSRFETLTFVFFMTLLMGVVLSGIFEVQTPSGDDPFIARWFTRFVGTYVIVLPVVALVSPVARFLTDKLVMRS